MSDTSQGTRKYVVAECDTCHKKFYFPKDGVTAAQLHVEVWLYCPEQKCQGRIREVSI